MSRLVPLLPLVLVLLGAPVASASPGVLVLFTDERTIPAHGELESALRSSLELPDADVEYSAEFLDVTRFGGPAADEYWRDFLRRKYAGHDIRLLVVVAVPALDFVLTHQAELFPGIPVVVTAVGANVVGVRKLPPNFIPVPFTYEYAKTIAAARRLQPAAREVVIPVGTSPDDLRWEAILRQDLPAVTGGMAVRYLKDLPLEGILEELSRLTPESIVLAVPINRDGAGRARVPVEVGRRMVEASGAPVYTIFSTALGIGIVGGEMTTYEHMGQTAGAIVKRVIAGEALPAIAATVSTPSAFVVDWRARVRWGLDESRLPPGTEVRFKALTLWQEYRGYIVTVVSLLVLQAVSLVALLVQRRRRDVAEAKAEAHRSDLAHLTRVSLMGELSASVAHELNQPLTAILTNAEAAERFLRASTPDLDMVREIVADIAADDRRAGEVIRRMRTLLKKGDPQFQPVSLEEVVSDVARLVRVDLVNRATTLITDLPAELAEVRGDPVQLQQVVLNLVVNAADAMASVDPPDRRIWIRATQTDRSTVELSVVDRGSGIPADRLGQIFDPFFTTKREGLGMGLSICRTIIEAHGGRVWAANNVARGATFHISLPTGPGKS